MGASAARTWALSLSRGRSIGAWRGGRSSPTSTGWRSSRSRRAGPPPGRGRPEGAGRARAGLQEGDVLVAVDDRAITRVDDLHRLLAESAIGRTLGVTVLRGLGRLDLAVVPAEAP